jgi:threonine dehydrogenase-like Zn-dependent dehydrogenase
MRGAVIHAPGDVRSEALDDPEILKPTDAIIRTAVTCVCGSDLWPYRGPDATDEAHPMGHEYVGFVEEVGSEVTAVWPGQFAVGSFATSDNTCANCRNGWQSNCLNREFMSTCQAECVRIPNAQDTLVDTDEVGDGQRDRRGADQPDLGLGGGQDDRGGQCGGCGHAAHGRASFGGSCVPRFSGASRRPRG